MKMKLFVGLWIVMGLFVFLWLADSAGAANRSYAPMISQVSQRNTWCWKPGTFPIYALAFWSPISGINLKEEQTCVRLRELKHGLRPPEVNDDEWSIMAYAVMTLAHEAAHADQYFLGLPLDEHDANCRATKKFRPFSYRLGVGPDWRRSLKEQLSFTNNCWNPNKPKEVNWNASSL